MKNCYVIVYHTEGFQDLCVFSSLKKAREEFDKIAKKYNMKESAYSYYICQAFGEIKNGKATLTLMKKIINYNGI